MFGMKGQGILVLALEIERNKEVRDFAIFLHTWYKILYTYNIIQIYMIDRNSALDHDCER